MVNSQMAMGLSIMATCLFGLWHHRWLLENTHKGQRMVRWFGEVRGLWVLRGLLVAGALFGFLLAINIIHPIHWKTP